MHKPMPIMRAHMQAHADFEQESTDVEETRFRIKGRVV